MALMTVNDTSPALSGTVNADLTGASLMVHIRRPDRTVLSRAGTVVDPDHGGWSMEWEDGDLPTPGYCYVELQVTFSNGKKQTFARKPDDSGDVMFSVRAELG